MINSKVESLAAESILGRIKIMTDSEAPLPKPEDIDLIVTDVDGTLLDSNHRLHRMDTFMATKADQL